ncbi:hypothetical protein LJC01_02405 [Clostridiaceae bacterium OttesenSCG-928-D20]|nr:hypothetical protein [Clostridiaceae bacterium OttesenSCG-928-D20]
MDIAIFHKNPSTLRGWQKPQVITEQKHFVIEKTIEIKYTDFENLVNDLLVSRWFIEENAELCFVDDQGVWHCLFVKPKGKKNGILIMSDGEEYPKWVAVLQNA